MSSGTVCTSPKGLEPIVESFDAKGLVDRLLKSVPGYVTDTQYEADKQTRSIAYANGVTTSFTYAPQRRWLTGFETKQANGTVLLKAS